MVVAVIQEFVGPTVQQYDQVLAKMGLRAGAAGPPGQLFHWVAATDKELLITDLGVGGAVPTMGRGEDRAHRGLGRGHGFADRHDPPGTRISAARVSSSSTGRMAPSGPRVSPPGAATFGSRGTIGGCAPWRSSASAWATPNS